MAQRKKQRSKVKTQAKRRPAPKKKVVKAKKKVVRRKPTTSLVKEAPVQPPQPVQPTIQENPDDLGQRQEQIHDAEDAIVDEADEEELGEAV
jgi:hypothetical protein